MLRISKLADYGTVVMVYLAKREQVYSQQLGFRQGVTRNEHRSLPEVNEDMNKSGNAAENPSAKSLLSNARDIALHTHLTIPTVSKLLKRLVAAGLLVSERGVSGGYQLQRPAAEISVAQIIYALEDQRGLIECSLQPNDCSLQKFCGVQGNWRLISQAIEKALDSVSLEALAKPTLQAVEIDRIRQIAIGLTNGVSNG